MKRFLSLALALVMVFGMIPMASAATCANGNHAWEVDESKTNTQPTCTEAGDVNYVCSVEGCGATKNEKPAATGHKVTAGEGTQTTEATCTDAPTATGTCSVCGEANVTVTTGAALDHDWADATCTEPKSCQRENCDATEGNALGHVIVNGKCTRTGCTHTAASAYTVSTTTSMSLFPGETGTISVSAAPASGSGSATVTNKNFTSNKDSVATVDANGVVTAVAEGTATISITFTVGEENFSASCAVTVDKGDISCDRETVKVGSNGDLDPTLNISGVTPEWTFSTNSSIISLNSTTGEFRGLQAGTATVKISCKYTKGSTTTTVTKDVLVSVYEEIEIDVKLKDNVMGSFDFADKDILASVSYNGSPLDLDIYPTLQDALSESYATSIIVTEASSVYGNIGTLSGGGSTTSSSIGLKQMSNIKFALNGTAGKQMLYYTLYNDKGMIVAEGELTISTSGFNAAVEYDTYMETPLTLDEYDFYKYWVNCNMSGTLDYVEFDVDSVTPYYGELYTTASSTTRKVVTSSMKFSYKYASSTDDYDLDTVTFVPEVRSKAYTEEIPFTCYGTTASQVLTGVLVINVTDGLPFVDVKTTDYFYDAVAWAVNEGITTGTSATTFSPSQVCTRGQVVTFLWRAAGEPAARTTVNPFSDVKKTDYFYNAVLWAYEEGITTGITATTFGPNQAITRSQAVTFLYRYNNEPAVTGTNSFVDVSSTAYYDDAVTWAVKNGITNGMSATKFAPNDGCTRAQIVTFLYRDAE